MLSTVDLVVLAAAATALWGLAMLLGLPLQLALGGACLVFAGGARELARAVFITRQASGRLLALDLAFVAVTVVAFAALMPLVELEKAVLFSFVIGNMVAAAMCAPPLYRQPLRLRRSLVRYRSFWSKSRWALLGAGLSEGQLRLYIFVVQVAHGSAALGLLHAARVLVNPVFLVVFAWTRATRPFLRRHLVQRDFGSAFRVIANDIICLLLLAFLYAVFLFFARPVIEEYIFSGHNYNIMQIVVFWSILSIISVPSICIDNYFQAKHEFRMLTIVRAISMMPLVSVMSLVLFGFDLNWIIAALIVAEVVVRSWLSVLLAIDILAYRRKMGAVHV